MISSPFLPAPLTSFAIGTDKVLYFSVFSPKQLNSSSNSFASSFMKKNDNHSLIRCVKPKEFLYVYYMSNYICHRQFLYIYQYNDNDL